MKEMTKQEAITWCRKMAPALWKRLSDEELLIKMEATLKMADIKVVVEEQEELNEINNDLDFMVLELCKEFGTEMALQGGYVLTKLMPNVARQTTDIDLTVKSFESLKTMRELGARIAEELIQRGRASSYKFRDFVEDKTTFGLKITDSSGGKLVGIDVSVGDTGRSVVSMKVEDFETTRYSVERMLSDKLSACASRVRFRRTKDLYDIYIMTECFDVNVGILRELCADKGFVPHKFTDDDIDKYVHAYSTLDLRSLIKGKKNSKPDFEVVFKRMIDLSNMVYYDDTESIWDHKERTYVK